MLYPELPVQPTSAFPGPVVSSVDDVPTTNGTVMCRHPSDGRACLVMGNPPDDRLFEVSSRTGKPVPLPFAGGTTVQYLGAAGLAALVGDALTLFEHRFGFAPVPLQQVVGTYAGRLVAVAGDVLVLAGAEGPWAFFRYRDDRLTPIGEIRPDSFKVFEHFVNNDRLFLVGRGAGEEVLTVEPMWYPLPEATPDHVAPFSYGESWLGVHGFPSAVDGWRGTREYSRVVAQTLADQGICVVTETPRSEPTTVVLWYRDCTRSVSLATIPDRCIDPDARRSLLSIDGAHLGAEESVANVQHVLEPVWEFAIARVTEGGDEHRDGVSVVGRITNIVRVRTL